MAAHRIPGAVGQGLRLLYRVVIVLGCVDQKQQRRANWRLLLLKYQYTHSTCRPNILQCTLCGRYDMTAASPEVGGSARTLSAPCRRGLPSQLS